MVEPIDREVPEEIFNLFLKGYIHYAKEGYQETGDTRYLLRLFRLCYEGKEPQLPEVMDWLAKALIQFENNNGTDDLNKLLGLNSPGRGKQNSIAMANLRSRQHLHLGVMDLLIYLFGVSITAAAEGVWARESAAERPVSDASWLEQQYRRNWKEIKIEHPSSIDCYPWKDRPEEVRKFLESFPEEWRARYVLK